ncbi:uncharacterized protein LOC136086085 [Hydra vulgaris]|uniref:Uncharacterized protein LOC136086085 n=1 Tax=Hydra vulgaris TaxID=6087 RepID=A0ABM4CRD1_HYDVU
MQQDEIEDCDAESLSENDSVESETEDPDEIKNNKKCLAFELGMWAASFSISMVAISSFLSILRISHLSLPKDPRTLLKTPCASNVRVVEGGSYFHFGIVNSLQHLSHLIHFFKIASSEVPVISLQINFDGLPLHKSTIQQFWPILAKVSNPFNSDPFLIGLFCGMIKPVHIDEYI